MNFTAKKNIEEQKRQFEEAAKNYIGKNYLFWRAKRWQSANAFSLVIIPVQFLAI